PLRDRRRDRLPGHREVVDRLRGLPAPELLGHAIESSHGHLTGIRRNGGAGSLAAAAVVPELVPGCELRARAAGRGAEALFVTVDRLPALVVDVRQPPCIKKLGEITLTRRQQPGFGVFEHLGGGLGSVLLVRPDDAARAALDPAGAVQAAD